MHVGADVCMYVCVCMWYVWVYVCMRECMYVCVCMYVVCMCDVHVYVCECACGCVYSDVSDVDVNLREFCYGEVAFNYGIFVETFQVWFLVHWFDRGNQWLACSHGPEGNTCCVHILRLIVIIKGLIIIN